MRVLHVAGNYDASPVYQSLIDVLAERGIEQYLIARDLGRPPRQSRAQRWTIGAPSVWSRPFLGIRTARARRQIVSPLPSVDLVHAHMLGSDGFLGVKIASELRVPYVISIRGTDRHAHWKYRRTTRPRMRSIARDAGAVLTLNPSYASWVKEVIDEEIDVRVIPNGIDDYWLTCRASDTTTVKSQSAIRVLYVGDMSPNKNLNRLVRACSSIAVRPICLTIVGAKPTDERRVAELRKVAAPELDLRIVGRTDSRDVLARHYAWADVFCLVSRSETFGLVAAEAISQAVPTVVSRGESIDGFFPDSRGLVACDPRSVQSIASAIVLAHSAPESHLPSLDEVASLFSWGSVAREMEGLYRDVAERGGPPGGACIQRQSA